jgi:hypothetical protein
MADELRKYMAKVDGDDQLLGTLKPMKRRSAVAVPAASAVAGHRGRLLCLECWNVKGT